jgi:hypothetical protein
VPTRNAPPDPTAAPLELEVAISTFAAPGTTSTTPTRRVMAWPQLVGMLTTHERRRDKDGQGWSPFTYKPGTTRGNANVVESSCAVGDFDHQTPDDYDALKVRLEELDLEYVLHSTYSSTAEELAFRVVIPFTRPVLSHEHADVWRRVNQHVFAGRNDEQAKDASRFFYRPQCPLEGLPFAEHHPGAALDPDALPEVSAGVQDSGEPGEPTRGAVDYPGYETLGFIAFGAPVGSQRGRALGATRALLASGYSVEETAAKVFQGLQNSPCGDPDNPWTYEHALAFAEDLAQREPAPLAAAPVERRVLRYRSRKVARRVTQIIVRVGP